MMMRMALLVHLLLLGSLLDSAAGTAEEDILQIQDEFWTWRMEAAPEFATIAGVYSYNDQLTPFNATQYELDKNYVSGLVTRLDGVKVQSSFDMMSPEARINYDVLHDMLSSYVNGYQWHAFTIGNPVNFLEGPHISIGRRFGVFPFNTFKDFFDFLARMAQFPLQIDDMIVLMQGAISRGLTNHRVSMEAVTGQLDNLISQGIRSEWFTRFEDEVNKSDVPKVVKKPLLIVAENIILNRIMPAYKRLRDFIVDEYIPNSRREFGVSSLPGGAEFYEAALQWHLSVDMTANQVHETGLQEVARIAGNMQRIMDAHNFTGTIREYFQFLSADPKFHIKTQDEGVEMYKDIINNRITPLLPKFFKDIPTNPLLVEAMSYDGPPGRYLDGSADGSRPGIFKVNLQHPETVNTYEMAALSLHEALPGHHLQSSYAATASLPAYRRTMDFSGYYLVPFHFPFYTAYMEGWGLYSEYLGEEMGVYLDDSELMGRYSTEMFRATRLVVDTGLHTKGWSKDKAVEYMLNYTALPRHNAQVEVNRYITWPGQACAYKIGELKMHELRDKATERLGDAFDLKDFHSVVLTAGPLPLRVLENIVDDWIEQKESSVNSNSIG